MTQNNAELYKDQIATLVRSGRTPRQIAEELNLPRTQVQDVIASMQVRKQRGRFKSLLTVFAGSVIFLTVSWVVWQLLREPTDREVQANLYSLVKTLSIDSNQSTWLLEKEPEDNITGIEQLYNILQTQQSRIERSWIRNSGLPGIAKERQLFDGQIRLSLFRKMGGGTTQMVAKSSNPPSLGPDFLEVVFYAHEDINHPKIVHRTIWYNSSWRALMIAAFHFRDEAWFDAQIAHELWHAKEQREGGAGTNAPALFTAWTSEELDAHQLESDVLNNQTQGKFRKQISAIAGSIRASTLKGFLLQLEPRHLKQLSALFTDGSEEETNLRAATYFLELSKEWVETHFPHEQWRQQEIQAYVYLFHVMMNDEIMP